MPAKVYWVHSPSLPLLDIQIDYDASGRRDPVGRVGLASATAQMMGKGLKAKGTVPAMDENAMGDAWADLGAMFSSSASSDRMSRRRWCRNGGRSGAAAYLERKRSLWTTAWTRDRTP